MDRYDIRAGRIASEAARNEGSAQRISNATLMAVNAATRTINSINETIAGQKAKEYTMGFDGEFSKLNTDGYFAKNVDADGNVEYLTQEQSIEKYNNWVNEYQANHPAPKNILAKESINNYLKDVYNGNIEKASISSIQQGVNAQKQMASEYLKKIANVNYDAEGSSLAEYKKTIVPGDGSNLLSYEKELFEKGDSTSLKMLDYSLYLREKMHMKPEDVKFEVESKRSLFAEQDFINRFVGSYSYSVQDQDDVSFWEDVNGALSSNDVVFFGRSLSSEERNAIISNIESRISSTKNTEITRINKSYEAMISEIAEYENKGGYVTQAYMDYVSQHNGIDFETDLTDERKRLFKNYISYNEDLTTAVNIGKEISEILNSNASGNEKTSQIISIVENTTNNVQDIIRKYESSVRFSNGQYYIPFESIVSNERMVVAGVERNVDTNNNFNLDSIRDNVVNPVDFDNYAFLEAQIDLYNNEKYGHTITPELQKAIDDVIGNEELGIKDTENAILYISNNISEYKDIVFNKEKTVNRDTYNERKDTYSNSYKTKLDKMINNENFQGDVIGLAMLSTPELISTATYSSNISTLKAQWKANQNVGDGLQRFSDKRNKKDGFEAVRLDNPSEKEIDEEFNKWAMEQIEYANYIVSTYGSIVLGNGDTLNSMLDKQLKNEGRARLQEVSDFYVPNKDDAYDTDNLKARTLGKTLLSEASTCITKSDWDEFSIKLNSYKKNLYEEDYEFLSKIIGKDYKDAITKKGINISDAISEGISSLGNVSKLMVDSNAVKAIMPMVISKCSSSILSDSLDTGATLDVIMKVSSDIYTQYKVTESMELGKDNWKKVSKGSISEVIFKTNSAEDKNASYLFFNKETPSLQREGIEDLFSDEEFKATFETIISSASSSVKMSDEDIKGMLVEAVLTGEGIDYPQGGSDDEIENFWDNVYDVFDNMNSYQRNVIGDILNTTKGIVDVVGQIGEIFPAIGVKGVSLEGSDIVIGNHRFNVDVGKNNKLEGVTYITPSGEKINLSYASEPQLKAKAVILSNAMGDYLMERAFPEGGDPMFDNVTEATYSYQIGDFDEELISYGEYYIENKFGEEFSSAVSTIESLTGKKLVVELGNRDKLNIKLSFK